MKSLWILLIGDENILIEKIRCYINLQLVAIKFLLIGDKNGESTLDV